MMQRKHISWYTSALAINLLLMLQILLPQAVRAQSRGRVMAEQKDTVALFRGMAVSVDLFGAGQMLLGNYGQYEAALRFNLKDKYFPIIELGYGKADATDDGTNLHYTTSAPYGRIGIDWNLMKNKHDDYRLYGGVRYGFTAYKFDLQGPDITDPVWGEQAPYQALGQSCNYHWLEGVFGVDAKLLGPIRLGWSVRYRRRLAHSEGSAGNSWYVPGFGQQGGSRFGGTFNVAYEF